MPAELFDPDELRSDLAEVVAQFLPNTATIKRYTTTDDGLGGATETNVTTTTQPCRITVLQSAGNREWRTQNGVTVILDVSISFAYGIDIKVTDEIEIDGRLFKIVALPLGTYSVATTALCTEVVSP